MAADPIGVLAELTTPHLADACIRVGVPVRCGPAELAPVIAGARCCGRAFPVRHSGSVDVFLEAFDQVQPGDVLVVDNGGRLDEACVGDLIALEAKRAGVTGIVIWGLHRDTTELLEIGLPFFTLGSIPTGPLRLEPRASDWMEWAQCGPSKVTLGDIAVCDPDGVLFLPTESLQQIIAVASGIRETERKQARDMRAGKSLRQQTRFSEYLSARTANPALGFREHLRKLGGAIEE